MYVVLNGLYNEDFLQLTGLLRVRELDGSGPYRGSTKIRGVKVADIDG